MKITIAILIAGLMVLTACTADDQPPVDNGNGAETPQEQPAETPSGSDEVNREAVSEFEQVISDAEDPLEVRNSMEAIMETENEITGDAVLSAYIQYLRDDQSGVISRQYDDIQNLQPYFEEGTQNLSEESISDESLRSLYSRFTDMGYRFIQIEGSIEPMVDYGIVEEYSAYISDEMIEYGQLKSLESDQMWAADGGIVISIEELGERIAQTEAFLEKYPDAEEKPEIIQDLRNYLTGFFGGLDNTPVDENGEYSETFISAYENFLVNHPDTKTAEVLDTYYAELSESDFAAPYNVNDPDSIRLFKEQISYKVDEVVNDF